MPEHQPLDASKLNNAPAPLPIPAPPRDDQTSPASPPLRSPDNGSSNAASLFDSAYLDGHPEPPSHPTVAETGVLAASPTRGPMTGQLQRRESKSGQRIIRLASFGGEGLDAKPPAEVGADDTKHL